MSAEVVIAPIALQCRGMESRTDVLFVVVFFFFYFYIITALQEISIRKRLSMTCITDFSVMRKKPPDG